jgi:hypothetical protein
MQMASDAAMGLKSTLLYSASFSHGANQKTTNILACGAGLSPACTMYRAPSGTHAGTPLGMITGFSSSMNGMYTATMMRKSSFVACGGAGKKW